MPVGISRGVSRAHGIGGMYEAGAEEAQTGILRDEGDVAFFAKTAFHCVVFVFRIGAHDVFVEVARGTGGGAVAPDDAVDHLGDGTAVIDARAVSGGQVVYYGDVLNSRSSLMDPDTASVDSSIVGYQAVG